MQIRIYNYNASINDLFFTVTERGRTDKVRWPKIIVITIIIC